APDRSRCDFDHFGDFVIADPRSLPPNGYGLHGMAGGVWEWTSTIYDALGYHRPGVEPDLSILGEDPPQRVLRGGSWSDSAAAVTVSFRHALVGESWRRGWTDAFNPNVGFRLVRRHL
ncbi:MAG: SUMF1/EgtB/PvdO family nonheme iron enzyme, partial [Myxococcales bacterium]|nr:SUMF1/EgtB/PvdO family nonheme iron enzyme [Myxococcales bacterium]